MNKERRKEIDRVIDRLADIRCSIESIRDDEEDCYACLPDSLQETERGCAMEEAIDCLDQALSSLEEAVDSLEESK